MKLGIGLNGLIYGIFENTSDAWDYAEKYDLQIACFSGYENAVLLQRSIGEYLLQDTIGEYRIGAPFTY